MYIYIGRFCLDPGFFVYGKYTNNYFFSLLDILAGRKDPSGISGQVLIDGTLPPSNFKCMVGYVLQVTPTDNGLPYIRT